MKQSFTGQPLKDRLLNVRISQSYPFTKSHITWQLSLSEGLSSPDACHAWPIVLSDTSMYLTYHPQYPYHTYEESFLDFVTKPYNKRHSVCIWCVGILGFFLGILGLFVTKAYIKQPISIVRWKSKKRTTGRDWIIALNNTWAWSYEHTLQYSIQSIVALPDEREIAKAWTWSLE